MATVQRQAMLQAGIKVSPVRRQEVSVRLTFNADLAGIKLEVSFQQVSHSYPRLRPMRTEQCRYQYPGYLTTVLQSYRATSITWRKQQIACKEQANNRSTGKKTPSGVLRGQNPEAHSWSAERGPQPTASASTVSVHRGYSAPNSLLQSPPRYHPRNWLFLHSDYTKPSSCTGTSRPGMNCRPDARATLNTDRPYISPNPRCSARVGAPNN
jgi:hypothetical protein